jgi:hypothetical protein
MFTNIIQNMLTKLHQNVATEATAADLQKGKMIGDSITDIVGTLRANHLFPNKSINELMILVWDLFGKRVVPMVAHGSVSTISFALVGNHQKRIGMVMVPFTWMDQLMADPLGCGGGVVFVGSQARDYYNMRLYEQEHSKEVQDRAKAYEAEYLLAILEMRKNQGLEYKLNNYQKSILDQFPKGIESENAKPLIYVSKSFSTDAQA